MKAAGLPILSCWWCVVSRFLGILRPACRTQSVLDCSNSMPAKPANLSNEGSKKLHLTNLIPTFTWIEVDVILVKSFHAEGALEVRMSWRHKGSFKPPPLPQKKRLHRKTSPSSVRKCVDWLLLLAWLLGSRVPRLNYSIYIAEGHNFSFSVQPPFRH
jgi:hypothetical protein